MSQTFQQIVELIKAGDLLISNHGYDELAADGILATEVIASISQGVVVEDYPHYHRGPSVLVLQFDNDGRPIHIVWGIPKGKASPAVLVTAYRPDPMRWSNDFLTRR